MVRRDFFGRGRTCEKRARLIDCNLGISKEKYQITVFTRRISEVVDSTMLSSTNNKRENERKEKRRKKENRSHRCLQVF